ncbi:unnamed protein product [marine sediment metagenome]|uniref:Uncharacterized protein n=1 Tax=marine sediment metagenome TaxID=412755 RepID=X1BL18_9ZZZZ
MLSHVFCDLNNIFINLINIVELRGLTMEQKDIQFWQEIDDRIQDIIYLIRLKHKKFNGTPVEKVIVKLSDAYRASGQVADAIDKGWMR